MRPVRTISRKDLGEEALTRPRVDVFLTGILRDYMPNPCRNQWEDIVRSMWRHIEAGRNDQPRLASLSCVRTVILRYLGPSVLWVELDE